MRNRSLAIGLGLVLSLLLTTTALPADELDLKPGEWEIQVQMQIPGMPFPLPPTTVKQCLTPDEPAPNPKVKDQECAVKDLKIAGNTVKWKVDCKMEDGQTMQGAGEVTFSGTTMSGTQTINGEGPGREVSIESTYTGKWIGPCEKQEK